MSRRALLAAYGGHDPAAILPVRAIVAARHRSALIFFGVNRAAVTIKFIILAMTITDLSL